MPEEFTYLNEFPIDQDNPLPYVDFEVGGADYWTTLSGFNKDSGGSPTDEQITESLEKAMSLFWNWRSFGVDATAAIPSSGVEVFIDLVDSEGNNDDGLTIEPADRQCSTRDNPRQELETSDQGSSSSSVSATVSSLYPFRMLNGGEFVGWGVSSNSLTSSAFLGAFEATVSLQSFASESGIPTEQDLAYINLGGFNFVCYARLFNVGSFDDRNVDASNLTASASDDIGRELEVTLLNLGTYTYS